MTQFDIPDNVSNTMEFLVKPEHSAAHLQSGSVEVLSTPSMILFMEQVARFAIEDRLPEGFSSVGTEVNIKHLKAVQIGETVTATCELLSMDNKKVEFKVEVYHGDTLLGSGNHTRFIIEVDRFVKSLNS